MYCKNISTIRSNDFLYEKSLCLLTGPKKTSLYKNDCFYQSLMSKNWHPVSDMHLQDELPARPQNGYTEAQSKEARGKTLDKTLAYGILVRADRGWYRKLIEEIENAYLKGNNNYPKTPMKAYKILVNYRSYNNNKRMNISGGLDQVVFVTEGKRPKTGKEFPYKRCYKCGKYGHYNSNCPGMKDNVFKL